MEPAVATNEIEQPASLTGLEIAVIGMAGRFPGAKNLDEFWDNLKNGRETIGFYSEQEMQQAGEDMQRLQNSSYVKTISSLDRFEYFDAFFFDYSSREAEIMDPQVRIMHEVCWEALESAGYDSEQFPGLIGIYAGANSNPSWFARFLPEMKQEAQILDLCNLCDTYTFCTRVSYKLNLRGPSMTVQTACSTSLVSIHVAVRGLLCGECDMALAGGASIIMVEKHGYLYQEGMILSPDGHCRSFDARSKGTPFGDGAGIVVLKRLEEAITDNDNILAVIKGSATNNDGNQKVGYMAPSMKGQADVIISAYRFAGIEPGSISYIEAHGTGTTMGDPIEITALKTAFKNSKKGSCRIGSVKSNVGHLNNSAGVVGFIKTVLALQHKIIPPTLHYETPNPEIDFENSPFTVNTQLYEWKRKNYPLRAGVNSIGGGGTNVHVILEEAPGTEDRRQNTEGREYKLILLSAKTETALDKMTKNLVEYFKNSLLNHGNQKNPINPGQILTDAAYTLQVGRKSFNYRRMTVGAKVSDVVDELSSPEAENVFSFTLENPETKVVFMFPGQGAQYVDMGLGLYNTEPVFRREMDRCFEILKPLMDHDLKEILYPTHPAPSGHPSQEGSRGGSPCPPAAPGQEDLPSPVTRPPFPHINQTEIAQPVLFAFEYALAKLLMSWGLKPGGMIGHSIGEYVAAHLAGVFSLEEALKLVVIRGQLMQQIAPGAMLSVMLSPDQLKPLLALHKEIALAAVNSSSLCVVSGTLQAIDNFEDQLSRQGHRCSRLHTSHAFHSPMMDPILEEFEEKVKVIRLIPPSTRYISNLTGQWIKTEEAVDPSYWSKHIRATVRFADGISELLKKSPVVFVEVGPGRTLSTFVTKHTKKKSAHMIVNLVRHPRENLTDAYYLLNKFGQVWLYGSQVDWKGFYSEEKKKQQRVPLPTYPFEGKYFWKEKPDIRVDSREARLVTKKELSDWFYIPSWNRSGRITGNIAAALSVLAEKTFNSPWLIFSDTTGLGSRLKNHLESIGIEIIVVKTGKEFTKVTGSEYIVNPGQDSDYSELIKELQRLGKIPGVFLHLWCISGEACSHLSPLDFEWVDRLQDLGFYSLFFLAKALGNQGVNETIQIHVMTDNMQVVIGNETLSPGKATVLAPCKIIPQEYPNISCSSMDIQKPEPGSPQWEKIIYQLLTELALMIESDDESLDTIAAFRGDYRWVQTFNPVRLEPGKTLSPRLKKGGVYLITGGLGGIGLILAEYLAKSVQARLILIGRSAVPARDEWEQWLNSPTADELVAARIRQIRSLEEMGGEVLVLSVDVTDLEQMQQMIARVEEKFGAINGVIHAAGVEDGELIHTRTGQMSAEVMAPKIKGTLVLNRILTGRQLDFLILFSSLSAVMSPMGQLAYSAANMFLDAFSLYKTSFDSDGCYISSINWDVWNDVGMAARTPEQLKELQKRSYAFGYLASEGIEAFNRIIDENLPLVAVSPIDLQARIQYWASSVRNLLHKGKASDAKTREVHDRPNLPTPYVSPRNQLEQRISDVWRNYLGIEKVGANDNFFELGATSMDIIQVNSQLKEALGQNLSIVNLFNYPTVRSLAGFVAKDKNQEKFSHQESDLFERMKKGKGKLKDQRRKRL